MQHQVRTHLPLFVLETSYSLLGFPGELMKQCQKKLATTEEGMQHYINAAERLQHSILTMPKLRWSLWVQHVASLL